MKNSAALRAEIKEIRAKYDEIFAKGEPNEAVSAELREMDTKLEGLIAEYSLRAQDEKRAKDNREAMNHLFAGGEAQPTGDGERKSGQPEPRTMGEKFVNDPQFKSWFAGMTGNGQRRISDGVGVKSPTIEVPLRVGESKALITGLSSTSGGALVENDRLNLLVPAVRDEMRIVDLMTRMSTDSDTVEYVRVTSETNAAAGVLEATTVSNGAKPESAVAMAVVTAIVETLAHWVPITRRAASDAGQLMGYVDEFLRYGLMDLLNDQIINGTGTTPELVGLDDLSGTQAQAWDTNILTTTRKARTLVRITGGAQPTGYALNPLDWETIDLVTDNENRYYFGGPARVGTPVLWGLPVVEDEAITQGIGFVGDWRMGVVWDREQVNVLMTDSHSDFFIRNILVLLAEMRVAVGWLRPAAFVEIDLTAA